MFSILSFELYSHEQETVIGQQSEQIKYLQTTEGRAFGSLIEPIWHEGGVSSHWPGLENDASVLLQGKVAREKMSLPTSFTNTPIEKTTVVAINCGAIPDNLIESELFGHEQGAFTGAQ